MTYQEIVNRIQSVTDNHKMLADFGYGDISDLKVRFENTSDDSAVGADYPYLFLNPGVHQRNQSLVTYNFNMIVMDLARGEVSDQPYNNMLAIQSQCQQYIDDVLANLYYGFEDNPEVIFSSVSYTTFNERFQDNVAGVTANLTIQVPQPLDNCISPFPPVVPPPPVGTLVLDVNSTTNQTFQPDVYGNPQAYPSITLDTYDGMRPGPANFYNIQGPETGTWLFTEKGQARKISGTEPFIQPRILTVRPNSGSEYGVQPTTTTFPDNAPIGETFNYTCTWEIELDPTLIQYVAIQDLDDAATEPQYETLAGLNLTAIFTPKA